MDRRQFLRHASLSAMASGTLLAACGGGSGSTTPTPAPTPDPTPTPPVPTPTPSAKSRVIVVGGGMAGATVAKYLRLWGDAIDVTLVERSASYTSNILSSLVLTGQRSIGSLAYGYDKLKANYGVNVVLGDVLAIDPVGVKVTLAGGQTLTADRIVLAPGIDFDLPPGLADFNRMPHAWKAGAQTTLLADQLKAMPAGGTAILTIPKTPYRCPPGPYERACLLADWLRVNKPRSKLIVLDANPDIVAERDNFMNAFLGLHGGVIEYHNNAEVLQADAAGMNLVTAGGTFHGDVINLIPRQRAGALLATAGLANATEGRFGAVDVLSYASTVAGAGKVHIIGDASATTQPKAGHIANQEAKVCADAIARLLAGGQPDPAPVTNSSCYSTITMSQASWLHAVFQYDAAAGAMAAVPAATGASAGWNADDFKDMNTWFNALMADSFA
ncbi:FAD/NAD(P)-binding oxidoreductase [Ottowia sp.]|uniref:FAD/NAD(P)-binding oxidoreductase n=1 Tax=Ottowia sp. TaxID=1898956 RepID=UPI002CF8C626|nr:FAD/NAD(P)-binding oxidoreductase [Ottowia sp.]HOB66770.1 FAD/NAD(P)-binding oxidoreductase [Ottowia sp.]HPZ58731.1 FAD/NAD(P)-binding oxidoreductase [Ottowia sp.]HQD48097.1 FAD/NAD(P)-binding oxidoreductase [Ottowia sp.]